MITANVIAEIDKVIKDVWLQEICNDYANGFLLKEASLQCSFYHHLQNRLGGLMKENNLYLYPEFYFDQLYYFADLAIVQMDMGIEAEYIGKRMTDVAAVIELKYDGGTAKSTGDYIKTDVAKLKNYIKNMPYSCQYYFGVIYETDCYCLNWMDKRSTNNWARGRVTELNAGYLNDEVVFEVNSYNDIGIQKKKVTCEMRV